MNVTRPSFNILLVLETSGCKPGCGACISGNHHRVNILESFENNRTKDRQQPSTKPLLLKISMDSTETYLDATARKDRTESKSPDHKFVLPEYNERKLLSVNYMFEILNSKFGHLVCV
mmetsp:Transcript_14330/g.34940  ORF Transcript_14330/g.34940 Transcript_14330/m.34940 type:complete len:118 (+) Transcript_14330:268-621(+)